MSLPPTSDVRLHRSVLTRVFGGSSFQWFLAVVVVFEVAVVIFVSTLVGPSELAGLLAALIPGVPWALGVTAYARADGDGVHWRYYRPRSYSWSEIERLEFGSVVRAGASAANHIPAVRVVAGGRSHPVGPSAGVGPGHLTEFARGLEALARTRGVPAGATVAGNWWDQQQLG